MERAKREKGLQNTVSFQLPYSAIPTSALKTQLFLQVHDYALYILKYNFINTLVPFLSFLYGIFLNCMPHRVTTNWAVYKCDKKASKEAVKKLCFAHIRFVLTMSINLQSIRTQKQWGREIKAI